METKYKRGYGDGCEATHKFWLMVLANTKGIGPKTFSKIYNEAHQQAVKGGEKHGISNSKNTPARKGQAGKHHKNKVQR